MYFSKRAFRLSVTAIALAIAAVLLPGGASACGCGEFRGVVVAHGSSLYDMPWRIKAIVPQDSASYRMFEFSIGDFDDRAGYFTAFSRPMPKTFFKAGVGGSEEDAESGLSGGRVARLLVKMDDGEVLEVEPTRAPVRFRKRYRWLRGLRFFHPFFPSSQIPEVVTAVDAEGRVLMQSREERGGFYAEL